MIVIVESEVLESMVDVVESVVLELEPMVDVAAVVSIICGTKSL